MEMGFLEKMFDLDGDGVLNAAECEAYCEFIGAWLETERTGQSFWQ